MIKYKTNTPKLLCYWAVERISQGLKPKFELATVNIGVRVIEVLLYSLKSKWRWPIMPQSPSTILTGHQRKERWGTNNDKTDDTYGPPSNKQRRTATEKQSRYYCIKTENICYSLRYFLHYFVLPFHRFLANAISTDYARSRACRDGSNSVAPVRAYWKLRSRALAARELPC